MLFEFCFWCCIYKSFYKNKIMVYIFFYCEYFVNLYCFLFFIMDTKYFRLVGFYWGNFVLRVYRVMFGIIFYCYDRMIGNVGVLLMFVYLVCMGEECC